MKNINEYLGNYLIERSLDKKMCSESQYEIGKQAAYQTFELSEASKYKNLFLCYDEDSNSFSIIGFRTAEDIAELLGEDEDAYNDLNNLSVGDSKNIHGVIHFKIK